MLDTSLIDYNINGTTHQVKSSDLKLIESILIPEPSEDPEVSEEKKLIYKIFSMQYTVMSALMTRSDFFKGADSFNNAFLQHPLFKQIRKVAVEYGEWVVNLFQCYKMLWEPTNLKLFNYFWR